MTQTPSLPGETIKNFILRLTTEAWEQNQEGVLLSRIGSEIAKKPEIAKVEIRDRKLSVFIQEELAGEVKILASQENPIVTIAIPDSAIIDVSNFAQYFPKADQSRKTVRASGVNKAILLAFSRPLASDKKRVISLSPIVRFLDIGVNDEVPEAAKVLDANWIALPDGEESGDEHSRRILNNIAAWRESVELEPKAIAAKSKVDDAHTKSVLDLLISSLSESEQKRIQIPLDIISKLKRRLV